MKKYFLIAELDFFISSPASGFAEPKHLVKSLDDVLFFHLSFHILNIFCVQLLTLLLLSLQLLLFSFL